MELPRPGLSQDDTDGEGCKHKAPHNCESQLAGHNPAPLRLRSRVDEVRESLQDLGRQEDDHHARQEHDIRERRLSLPRPVAKELGTEPLLFSK